ncbi:hypothetical protein [Aeromonas salmonicida]|uniref:hypothetical protein n=1 Tax=Aeromonas salmonicida TaxID=645 RepID=UPI0013B04340|nr:hypothetical protein [Aeromonas salmonicida]MDR6996175.1 hypothetical protein [Aeromonas salmonicida]
MTAIVTSRAGSASWRFIAFIGHREPRGSGLTAFLFFAFDIELIELVVNQGSGQHARHCLYRING